MMIIEKDIAELKVGNFVVEIAKQEKHFNLSKPGHIKSDAVINNLYAKGVRSVKIDTSKQLEQKQQAPKKSKRSVLESVKEAQQIFNQSKDISKNVFNAAFSGDDIDLKPVVAIADKTIDTIFENPDALACVINIRQKDDYLLEHSVSVSILITIFARYLEIDKSVIQDLAVGAFLHDVGKIMVPDEILNKPGKLTADEFEVMKSHVNHSISIINETDGVSALSLEIAAQHHEKLDGKGYPFNLPGDEITKYGRMISICDIFDALTANRCYKDGYAHIKAFSILRHLASDGQLDSELVDSFIKCMGVYPVGSLVELESSRVAIVETKNEADPTNPVVKSFYDTECGQYVATEEIDLALEDDCIKKGVRADDFDLDMHKIIEFLTMAG